MRLYLDDDLDSNLLMRLLERAGHEILSPRAVGTRGAADEEHWMGRQQQHAGMIVVYRENNPARDMTFQQIARAVTLLEDSGVPLANTVHDLNRWR